MKTLVAYALLLPSIALICGQTTPTASPQQPQRGVSDLVKSTVDSVVLIVVSDAGGKPIAEGSGFIASSDGKIVTNHHVVAHGRSAIVKLNNGAFFAVDGVLADDAEHDLAIIKVSGKNLPVLPLADSDKLSVGDHVVAIGSPLGMQNSVSDGIVSAFREDTKGRQWIQTTAPASHGNSGGPLLTMQGEAAGVLTMKLSEGENLNFAVPSKLLANFEVLPLGTAPSVGSGLPRRAGESVWTSMSSGHDYNLRMDGDYIYAEWVNLPTQLQTTTAFMRSELKKDGEKWTGKTRSRLPCEYKLSRPEQLRTGATQGSQLVLSRVRN